MVRGHTQPTTGIIRNFFVRKTKVRYELIRTDTCANRKYSNSKEQYQTYCNEFWLRPDTAPTILNPVNGIREIWRLVCMDVIQVPIKGLIIIIEVTLPVLQGKRPLFWSMRKMLEHDFKLSLPGRYITHGDRIKTLSVENYFLVHHGRTDDKRFSFQTGCSIRGIKRIYSIRLWKLRSHLCGERRVRSSNLGRDVRWSRSREHVISETNIQSI